MLRTEHILYRISQELSFPIAQVALAYASIITTVHHMLASGRTLDCGRLGHLSLEDGQITTGGSNGGTPNILRLDAALREYCTLADIPVDDTERVRDRLLAHVTEALDRRESVTLQDLGIWHPATTESERAFVPAPVHRTSDPDTAVQHPRDIRPREGAVDVARLIAEVHREMGFDPPGDTLDPGAIDVAALIRVVRNNIPELPAQEKGIDAASRPLRVLAAEPHRDTSRTDVVGTGGPADTGGDFERNREQLFHPPAQKSRKQKSIVSVLAMLFLAILIVALAWFSGLFEAVFSTPVVGLLRDAAPSAIHQHPPSLLTTEHVS